MKYRAEKGVSAAIATILLIALTVVAIGSIAAFLGLISPGKPPVAVSVTLETWSTTSVTVFHGGGDTLNKSDLRFLYGANTLETVATGTWTAGQSLVITPTSPVASLAVGDNIRLVYKPAGQVILNVTLE